MTSLPIPFWPYNLASVAWFGIASIMLLTAWFPGNNYLAAHTCIFLFMLFVFDVLILGPLYKFNK